MSIADIAFQNVFAATLVYDILYEDSEVDERYLGIDERSSVFAISGAGCRVAMHLAARPERIDAVDINRHHLAWTVLKTEASRASIGYDEFYDLIAGRGHRDPKAALGRVLFSAPTWAQEYWEKNARRLRRAPLGHGLTARMLGLLRKLSGVDVGFLERLCAMDAEQRGRVVVDHFTPLARSPLLRAWLSSPVQLLTLGVNFAQCDRMLDADEPDLVSFFLGHIRRLACTDLARNWFAWYAFTGSFNRHDPEALPPFLRPSHKRLAENATTSVRYHRANVFDVLQSARPRTWTHFTLCDAPDWMSRRDQLRLFSSIARAAKPGAVVGVRSVERECPIEGLGLGHIYQRMDEASRRATEEDRTRQYRSTSYYQVIN